MEYRNNTQTGGNDNALSRRALLSGLAAASAVAIAPEADAALPAITAALNAAENPAIFAAYEELQAANSELIEAKAALEWIADEWRHVWPLAPEEILDLPRAEGRYGMIEARAECDIVGRPIMRETAGLTKWRKLSADTPSTCFSVKTSENLEKLLAYWRDHEPKGRTEKSLSRNRAWQEACIRDTERELELAKPYEAAKAEIRERSGVEQAQRRVAEAKAAVDAACTTLSSVPVKTAEGLRIKAEALRVSNAAWMKMTNVSDYGVLGQLARFANDFLAINGGARA